VERPKQILQMRKIYMSAQTVSVWLGKEREETDLGEDDGLSWASASPSATLFTFLRSITGPNATRNLTRHGFSAECQSGLSILFRRPRFQRIWVLQEVALAHNVEVVCGASPVPWVTLDRATYRLSRMNDLSIPESMILHDAMSDFLEAVVCKLQASQLDAEGESLATKLAMLLFQNVSNRKTSDP
jgi:hypothetical protein